MVLWNIMSCFILYNTILYYIHDITSKIIANILINIFISIFNKF
jgi:hypothetical protein